MFPYNRLQLATQVVQSTDSPPANGKSVPGTVASSDSSSTVSQSSRNTSSAITITKYLVPHQCPTCLSYFSHDEIESHADACAENWFDAVGECPVIENISDGENDVENSHSEEISLIDDIEKFLNGE